jgi:hypothetical protein
VELLKHSPTSDIRENLIAKYVPLSSLFSANGRT